MFRYHIPRIADSLASVHPKIMEQAIPVFGRRSETLPVKTRACAYAVVTNAEGLVAAVRESHGLHLPGGGMDPSETPAETIHREVREEFGCRVILGERIGQATEVFRVRRQLPSPVRDFLRRRARRNNFGDHEHELHWVPPRAIPRPPHLGGPKALAAQWKPRHK